MKLFRTDSPAIVAQCLLQFNFWPLQYQADIQTASLCWELLIRLIVRVLLSAHAKANLISILSCYGVDMTRFDLRTAIGDLLVTPLALMLKW